VRRVHHGGNRGPKEVEHPHREGFPGDPKRYRYSPELQRGPEMRRVSEGVQKALVSETAAEPAQRGSDDQMRRWERYTVSSNGAGAVGILRWITRVHIFIEPPAQAAHGEHYPTPPAISSGQANLSVGIKVVVSQSQGALLITRALF